MYHSLQLVIAWKAFEENNKPATDRHAGDVESPDVRLQQREMAVGSPGGKGVERGIARGFRRIVQGERDPFGTREEVAGYEFSPSIGIQWLPDGDHSFVPRNTSGRTVQQNWGEAIAAVAAWIAGLDAISKGA